MRGNINNNLKKQFNTNIAANFFNLLSMIFQKWMKFIKHKNKILMCNTFKIILTEKKYTCHRNKESRTSLSCSDCRPVKQLFLMRLIATSEPLHFP